MRTKYGEQFAADTYLLAGRRMNFLPPNYQEDRILRVDADKFFLGIPADDAIAVNEIPKGSSVPFTPGIRALAAKKQYSAQSAQRLEAELWKLWSQ